MHIRGTRAQQHSNHEKKSGAVVYLCRALLLLLLLLEAGLLRPSRRQEKVLNCLLSGLPVDKGVDYGY